MKLLSEIFSLREKIGANIFATSRMIDEIAHSFHGAIFLNIRASNADLRTYLDAQMLQQPDIFDNSMRGMIASEVIRAADGMYVKKSSNTWLSIAYQKISGFYSQSYI